MQVDKAYNIWANNYDDSENKTRDLEKIAAQSTLEKYSFQSLVELGCGTGKNTEWLQKKAETLIALDFSAAMLQKAKEKINAKHVHFYLADLRKPWPVANNTADLITCSLTLEHLSDLHFIFQEGHKKLKRNGLFYICEFHPYKQYNGSKARFDIRGETIKPTAYTHHLSEYTNAATKNNFRIIELNEWFDEDAETPRLLSLVFEKQ